MFQLKSDKDKDLIKRLNSYQFKLSQRIFAKRLQMNISRNEAARLTGLSLKQYIEFEQGIDMTSSKNDYLKVLKLLS